MNPGCPRYQVDSRLGSLKELLWGTLYEKVTYFASVLPNLVKLFAEVIIFIRPIYELEDLTTYADDNYLGAENEILTLAIHEIKRKINIVT